jgi:hypothetical protein
MLSSTVVALLALGIVFAVPVVSCYRHWGRSERPDWPRLRRGLALNAALLVAVVALVVVSGTPADAGLSVPSVGAIIDGFLFGFIAFGGTMLVVALVAKFRGGVSADPASLVVFEQPLGRRLAVAATGATVEALLFFGVAIEAVLALGGSPYLAGAVAAVGLLAVRARFSVANALQWVPGAVVLSGIALTTGTAIPVLLVRLLYDGLTLASGEKSDYVSGEA